MSFEQHFRRGSQGSIGIRALLASVRFLRSWLREISRPISPRRRVFIRRSAPALTTTRGLGFDDSGSEWNAPAESFQALPSHSRIGLLSADATTILDAFQQGVPLQSPASDQLIRA